MGYETLELKQDGERLWVTLNRPDRLNALNRKMVAELGALFGELYLREDVRVVLLQGSGSAFCAGLDLKEQSVEPGTPATRLAKQRAIFDVVVAMRRCPQPIIALINGAASGGGFALALASDVRVASADARMNAAFIRVGLSGCDIGVSYFLPRMVGAATAAEYMLTGRFMDAARAYQLGLVSKVVATEMLAHEGEELAADMLLATPLGLRLTKEALTHAVDAGSLEAVIALEHRNQMITAGDKNFAEGVAAFLERRAPTYQND